MLDALIGWSVTNRVVVLLLAVALVVAGVYAVPSASLDVLPDFTPPRVVVQTEASGMATPDVEALVTDPLEQVLLGTPEVDTVRSTSSPGLSVVTMTFAEGVDVHLARQLVTERIQLLAGRLPTAVEAPRLAPIAAPVGALLKFALTGADPAALRTFGDWTLRPRLLAIPGVASVTIHGGSVERVEVQPDPVRLRERGVSVAEVDDAVAKAQAVGGAGYAETAASRMDVHADARLTLADAPEALAALPVAVHDGDPVRVGDVAAVVVGEEPPVGAAVYDGKPAVYVQVDKLPWADTVRTTRAVEAALAATSAELPRGATVEPPVFRQASFVATSVWSVVRAMLLGGVLVVVVLVAFLRSPRLAAISLTAIPLSILAALAVLVGLHASINAMTLGGLAIAVGEVVDDAIVDVENVWRRLRENARSVEPRPPLEVIRTASTEVRGSVVYATVIVCLVLLPVLLLGGIAGRIFSPLAQAYVLAISASLLVALTVTPALCAVLLPPIATAEAHVTPFAAWLLARYRRLLRRVVDRPALVLGLAAGAATAALVALPLLGGRFLPEFHESSLIAEIVAVPGASLAEVTRLATAVEADALAPEAAPRPTDPPGLPEGDEPGRLVLHAAARAGRSELDEDAAPTNRVEMDLVVDPEAGGEWDEIATRVATHIGHVPGLSFVVEGFLGERVDEILSGETRPIVVKLAGPDIGVLRRLARQAAAVMEGVDGLTGVTVEPQIDVAQLDFTPDPGAMSRRGILAADLLDQVVSWRQGEARTEIYAPGGRVVDVAVAGPPSLRGPDALPDLPISTPDGATVPLGELARVTLAPAPALVNHEGGVRRVTIGADAAGAGLSGAVGRLDAALARDLVLPEGYRCEIGGEAAARSAAATELLLVGSAVLVGILVLLASAFRSLRDAGIVLLNLPLGLVGGVLAAALTPEGLSVAGFVGFVTLFGIIARNGIMLVSHKRSLDAEMPELPPLERVLRASEERLLPILMTAATAGLGLLPLALSIESAGSELEAPMALIVCGGLITSTALNMLVLPTLYALLARREAA